jgi:hypothetical protein
MPPRTTSIVEASGVRLCAGLSLRGRVHAWPLTPTCTTSPGLFILDGQISISSGRPPHIAPATYDAALPVQRTSTDPRDDLTNFHQTVKIAQVVRTAASSLVRPSYAPPLRHQREPPANCDDSRNCSTAWTAPLEVAPLSRGRWRPSLLRSTASPATCPRRASPAGCRSRVLRRRLPADL